MTTTPRDQEPRSENETPVPRTARRPPSTPLARRALSATLAATILATTAGVASAQEIATSALEQIAALVDEKLARTPAQQKIDSRLLYELGERRGGETLAEVPRMQVTRHADSAGRLLLDLEATVDEELLARIEALGGTVRSAFPHWRAVRVTLPIDQVEALAALPQVRNLRPADVYMTQMNTTEGEVAHAADVARATFSVDGTGVSVGAMSDSVDALADLQASGDLPPGVTVLPGQSGNPGTSEGTALLEIVHDMAPGAALFFATGQGGQAQMAQNILDLAAAGCRVIVDDVLYFAEPVFQDGVIAQAVDAVAEAGVAYYSAAGNSGNLAAGTAGVWEGDYLGTALPGPLAGLGASAHDFGGGQDSNEITLDSPFFFTLQWSDPSGASTNDYDLYLLDATLTNVIAASTNTQSGTQNPFELIDSTASDDLGNRLVVVQFAGVDRFLHLNTHRGQLATATDGQIFGHPAAEGAIAVAAVNVATAGGGAFTGGAANPVEPFSSDGPRRIFFEADGTPIGAALDGVQQNEVRDVPDVAAADGVTTATPGFNPFFGTSAAAPHAAGLAALIQQILSSLDAIGMSQRIKRDALDIEDPGPDKVSGSGIPKADDAIEGKMGFQGDTFSMKTKLGIGGTNNCFDEHHSGSGTNEGVFDALDDLLDSFQDGTQPFLFEFETDPDNLGTGESLALGRLLKGESENFETSLDVGLLSGEDIFPEGFEDPKSGTPLDAACIEIGMDDTLDSDCPVKVTSAVMQFNTPSGPLFDPPLDVSGAFSGNLWDGNARISVPGGAGQNVNGITIKLTMEPGDGPGIFADGFETGDASSWQ